ADRDAHHLPPAPSRATGKALAIRLYSRDGVARQPIALLWPIIGTEPDQHLIELHVMEPRAATVGGKPVGHRTRCAAMSFHHFGNARTPQMLDHRPSGKAAGAAREFKHIVRRISFALRRAG